jgi:hypothetical protein
MGLGAAASGGSGGDNITHFNGIRVRVTGSGNLRPTFKSLDDVTSLVLVPLVMASTGERSLYRICNYVTQQAALELTCTAADETFRINRIIIYAKTIYKMVPA